MNHAVYPKKAVQDAFKRALELSPGDCEAATRAAAQSLGIPADAVREVVSAEVQEA